ncbi:hypothetical protein GCM10025857_03340 [Alicyclobacillus contaminans]|nr:hypothetical protein GCM10025857_03340 [Alicyclobacillus contaminans]
MKIVPEQASLVKEIYRRVLKGQSYLSIGKWAEKRTKERAFYAHKTLIYILTNPIYAGKLNQNGVLVDGLHDPIIDFETWKAVQSEVAKRHSGRRPYGRYLLSNLLTCGVCGSSMKHITYQDKRYKSTKIRGYYLCSAKHRAAKLCDSRFYPDDALNKEVVERLQEISLDPQIIQEELASHVTSESEKQHDVDRLQRQLNAIEDELNRWYDAYGSGKLDINRVQQKINALEDERRAILLRLDEMDIPAQAERQEYVMESLKLIGTSWDDMTDEERFQVLRAAVKNITVYPDGQPVFDWET